MARALMQHTGWSWSRVVACVVLASGMLAGCNGQAGLKANADQAAMVREEERKNFLAAVDLTKQGQRSEKAGKTDQAIIYYRRAIDTYRDIPVAWNNLGVLLMERNDNMPAADAFATAAELSPRDPRPYYNLGHMWDKMGYPTDAKKYYDQALKRDENHLPSLRAVILLDSVNGSGDEITQQRIRRAMLSEKDPKWIERYQRESIRLRETIAAKKRYAE
jgi:tetratricopeptide (TPR) repeat protein